MDESRGEERGGLYHSFHIGMAGGRVVKAFHNMPQEIFFHY